LLLFVLAAAATPPPAQGAWVEFDRRPAGWDVSPFEYDSGSIRRDGPRVRVTYRHKFFLSGLPDPAFRVGIEINCVRRRARVYRSLTYQPLDPRRGNRPYSAATPTISTPIAPASIEDSLARHVCPVPAAPARQD
jgi:hypothetical protein